MDYLLSDIWKYARNTILDLAGYRSCVVLVVLLSAFVLVIPGRRKRERAVVALLLPYLVLIFSSTVLLRGPATDASVATWPFWSYWRVVTRGDLPLALEILENVILFVPVGMGLGYLCRDSQRREVLLAVGFVAAFSASIEVLQLAGGVGLCEFDDVFDNTLGAVVGVALVLQARRLLARARSGSSPASS